METALQAGVAECFANPGTTKLPIVAALDRTAGMIVMIEIELLDPENLGPVLAAFKPEKVIIETKRPPQGSA